LLLVPEVAPSSYVEFNVKVAVYFLVIVAERVDVLKVVPLLATVTFIVVALAYVQVNMLAESDSDQEYEAAQLP
jgi:hypothetical protein